MEENRVEAQKGGIKWGWIIPAVIAVVLAAAYLGLCAMASRDVLWAHTALGGVDVSGLSPSEAVSILETELSRKWSEENLTVTEPDSRKQYQLPLAGVAEPLDLAADVQKAGMGGSGDTPFLLRGARFLMNFFSGDTRLPLKLELTSAGEKAAAHLLDTMNQELGEEGGETTWTVADHILTVKKGVTVIRADEKALESGLMTALSGTGPMETEVGLTSQPPESPDWQAIYDEVFVEPADAHLDRETYEVVSSVTGVSFDVDQAIQKFEQAGEGEDTSIELVLTEPEITTDVLNKRLFRDTLGAAATKFTGSAARRQNIARACALMNGMVLFPGDEFSYSKTCSPYTVANGYGYAGAYVDGKTVDSLAGGICQGSSTLYWAVLKSNLKVTMRYPHIYEPSYISGGLDATVYGSYGTSGSLDFRFVNDTQSPIRITAYVDNSNFVRISIQGTNTTGLTGQPYSANRTVTQYAATVYEPNAGIPRGTTRRDYERTAYNAVSIDAYLQLVDANGNVVSNKFLHRDNYRLRNAVIFYNPADAALWGIDPATGLQSLTPVPPTPTAAPVETPAVPSETPVPVVSEAPEPAASEAPAPAESAAPAEPSVAPVD